MINYKKVYARVKAWRLRNPEKRKAQTAVYVARRNGTLKKKPCKVCGNPDSEAHHPNYFNKLKVEWLCKEHHVEADEKRRSKEHKLALK